MPDGAFQTAPTRNGGAVWHLAPFGTSRGLAFRAVWHFAPSGISRRLAFRAL
jgi:hypothetical protein